MSTKYVSLRKKNKITNVFIYIILITLSIIWLIPFIFLLLQSFRVESTTITNYVIPKKWGFDNYINLLTKTNFLKWYLNTLFVALAVSVLQTIIILSMSYALSRLRFKSRRLLMNLMLILGMFPGFLTMIVLYCVLKDINLTQQNAVWGLILVSVASSGMNYYICKGYLDTIPKSLDEAARVDGANRFQIFYKVMLPLAKPIIIYTLLTSFMAPWTDFIFARYIAFGEEKGFTVAVGLWSWLLKDTITSKYTLFCTGGVLVAIPVTILFMLLQKYYVEGVTGGAVKG